MASTRNSFLRAAAPGSVRFRCDEAIVSSIAKGRAEPFSAKEKRGAGRAPQSPAIVAYFYLLLALCGWTTSSNRVPPSRCTFFPVEVSTVPSPFPFALRRIPSNPYTPRVFVGKGPAEFASPP